MSDEELVKALRDFADDGYADLSIAAADRIEALTAELAKAVEALRFGVDLIKGDSIGHEWKKGQADFRRMARTTLAEIEGSNDP